MWACQSFDSDGLREKFVPHPTRRVKESQTQNAKNFTVASNGQVVFAPKAAKVAKASLPIVPAPLLAQGAAAYMG